jgi:two-component system nitrogen regulation sensor histidine kinase NtrY
MSIGARIRFLLLVLSLCCIATAISLKHSVSQIDLLNHEASTLQDNLHEKERLVYGLLDNPVEMKKAQLFHLNEDYALPFIKSIRAEGIQVLTFKKNELLFWSTFKAFPAEVATLPEGNSFYQFPNGWAEVIKKRMGDFIIVFLIEVKNQYKFTNKFLNNSIVPTLSSDNSLTLASFNDNDVYGIKDLKGKLLFEVKLAPGYVDSIYSNLEIWLWVVGLFSFCLFFNSICSLMVRSGKLLLATGMITLFFVVIRLTDLEFGWFNHQFTFQLFDPKVYGESYLLPSLGDFLLNVISITWIILFIYTYKDKYQLPYWLRMNKLAGIFMHFLVLLIFASVALLFDHIFYGLIINSKINFDITNIINLGWISWIGITILCLVWFNAFLLGCILMTLTKQLKVNNKERLWIFIITFAAYLLYKVNYEFNFFFITYSLFIFLLGWNIYLQQTKFYVYIYALMFFCLAFISASKYLEYNDYREQTMRYTIAQKLHYTDDPKISSSIKTLEQGITTDPFISKSFIAINEKQQSTLDQYINKKFLEGYLSQFENAILEYGNDSTATDTLPNKLSYYKNLVKSGSVKVSTFFYRLNDTFGFENYFGIIPIFDKERLIGTLVIELESQQYNYNSKFPELLLEGRTSKDENYSDYSFAFYNNGKLIKQAGTYTYKLSSADFEGNKNPQYVNDNLNFNHLIYSPGSSKLIIISKAKVGAVMRLATLSFFFLVFILFSAALYILIWLVKNIDESWSGWFNINRSLMINANKILYKTRIQLSIILSVVATLLIVGWTTYFYISAEYRNQQDELMRERIRKIQISFEKQIAEDGLPEVNNESVVNFSQFADVNASYLNLFNVKGDLLLSSLPNIYENGLIGEKMASNAYIYLHDLQRSEYLNPTEKIGDFTYSSAYAPIRNTQNKTVAYIGLPNYGNESDYQSKIGLFVNTLINIYALVFVAIGILAVFLANQITNPLTFIQESIRKTKLGQTNKPIIWARHDEIGALIKEYNKMIAALEESARKLARSEREHAWREMAKQIAHEIKNPLTPLKLGVQLLEKSWKENDPNFDKKFERFNKSFIEQIDSLSTIASEFSNFAKMPDTKLEKLQVLPIIEESRRLYGHADNTEIIIENLDSNDSWVWGDKDQLVRTFNNLFKNSIEAAKNRTDHCLISVKIDTEEGQLVIEVADNAKGIDLALQDRIFVPNFTTKSSGTGLGLAFVKQAVENAGGSVHFNSITDEGTTFYLRFPIV